MPLKPPGGPSRQTIGSAGQSVDDDDQLRPPEPNWKWVADLEVLCDFTDKTLEGELADEEFRRFLVATDLTKGDCTGAETMGLLHTTCGLPLRWRVSVMVVRRGRVEDVQRELFSWRRRIWRRVVYGGPCLCVCQVLSAG